MVLPKAPKRSRPFNKFYRHEKERPRRRRFRKNRPQPIKPGELLTKTVNGQPASDIEERFAKALRKDEKDFQFQPSYAARKGLPGEIRLDFMIYDGYPQPVQVDGEIAHKTAAQKSRDDYNDARLNELFRGSGAMPVIRIPGHMLQNQDMADALVRAGFGRFI